MLTKSETVVTQWKAVTDSQLWELWLTDQPNFKSQSLFYFESLYVC